MREPLLGKSHTVGVTATRTLQIKIFFYIMREYLLGNNHIFAVIVTRLVAHERTNTREKSYSCNHCNKDFAWKNHLLIHKKNIYWGETKKLLLLKQGICTQR